MELVVPGRVELPTHPCEGYVITVSPQNQKMVVPRRVELQTHPCQGYVITVSPRNYSFACIIIGIFRLSNLIYKKNKLPAKKNLEI